MKYAIIIVRVLLGLMFAVFGSNAFLHFIPMPPLRRRRRVHRSADQQRLHLCHRGSPSRRRSASLLGARFVPLGLTLLGPVIVNIVLYHIFLDAGADS